MPLPLPLPLLPTLPIPLPRPIMFSGGLRWGLAPRLAPLSPATWVPEEPDIVGAFLEAWVLVLLVLPGLPVALSGGPRSLLPGWLPGWPPLSRPDPEGDSEGGVLGRGEGEGEGEGEEEETEEGSFPCCEPLLPGPCEFCESPFEAPLEASGVPVAP